MKLFSPEWSRQVMHAAQQGDREAINLVGKMIIVIVQKAKLLPRWINYNGECAIIMKGEALVACSKYIRKYDPSKGMTPYSWFLMITNHYFNYGILKYYRQQGKYKSDKGKKICRKSYCLKKKKHYIEVQVGKHNQYQIVFQFKRKK
jgi:hypothetical protein